MTEDEISAGMRAMLDVMTREQLTRIIDAMAGKLVEANVEIASLREAERNLKTRHAEQGTLLERAYARVDELTTERNELRRIADQRTEALALARVDLETAVLAYRRELAERMRAGRAELRPFLWSGASMALVDGWISDIDPGADGPTDA